MISGDLDDQTLNMTNYLEVSSSTWNLSKLSFLVAVFNLVFRFWFCSEERLGSLASLFVSLRIEPDLSSTK